MKSEEKIREEIEKLRNEANRLASYKDIRLARRIEMFNHKIIALKWVLEDEDE